MWMKRWRRFRTRFTLRTIRRTTQGPEHLPSIQQAVQFLDPLVLKDINHPQSVKLYIQSIAPNVVASSAILQQAVAELKAGHRITNVFAEIVNQSVSSNRYFLDSKGNYIDVTVPLLASKAALTVLLQYLAENIDSTGSDQIMNCRAIEYQLPYFYRYILTLMHVAANGPLRK